MKVTKTSSWNGSTTFHRDTEGLQAREQFTNKATVSKDNAYKLRTK